MYHVLIVEDDPMARQLLEIYLDSSDRYHRVRSIEIASLAEFCCHTSSIDLILMDVCTAMNTSGLDAAERIKAKFPDIKIIIITSQPECSFLDRAHAAGVDSCWYKNSPASEILDIMDRTMAGEHIYPESSPSLILGETSSEAFSARELEVLRELVAGKSDAEIAEKLYIAISTVKFHVQSLKSKTGFRNRTELAVGARESGLIININK